MSNETSQTHSQLENDLNARIRSAIVQYAQERGLTEAEVLETVRELLLTPQHE